MDGGDRRYQPIAAPDFALHVQPSGSSEDDGFVVRLRVQPLGRADIAARVQAVKPIVAPGSEQKRGHAARSRAIAERSHGAIRRGPLGLRSQPPRKAATVCTRFPATAGSAKRPMRLVDRHSPTYPITPDLRSHPAKNGKEGRGMSPRQLFRFACPEGTGRTPATALYGAPNASLSVMGNGVGQVEGHTSFNPQEGRPFRLKKINLV